MIKANSVVLNVVKFITYLQFSYQPPSLEASRCGLAKWNPRAPSFAGLLAVSSLWCRALDRTPAGHQVEYQDDHGHHDQDVNEIATEVTEKSHQPQDQQYY